MLQNINTVYGNPRNSWASVTRPPPRLTTIQNPKIIYGNIYPGPRPIDLAASLPSPTMFVDTQGSLTTERGGVIPSTANKILNIRSQIRTNLWDGKYNRSRGVLPGVGPNRHLPLLLGGMEQSMGGHLNFANIIFGSILIVLLLI
jgi:hypothetical protein